jgi:hypothetical protein
VAINSQRSNAARHSHLWQATRTTARASSASRYIVVALAVMALCRSPRRARGSARTSAHQFSDEDSCGCDHDRRLTASWACSIAAISRETSGRLVSSREKLVAICASSPQRQGRLDHAPDVGLDECERSARQLSAFLLGNIPDLGGDCL